MRKFFISPYADTSNEIELPKRKTKKAAGYDIRANEMITIPPGQKRVIRTGITVQCPDDEFLDLRIRSGLAHDYDLTLQNDAGVIDADYYPKEIKVMIRNEGDCDFHIMVGDRIAQGIFLPYYTVDDEEEPEQERDGGFGHTGVN